MFWEENSERKQFKVPDTIVDVVFGIDCRCLPVEHTHALSAALRAALPWLDEEQDAGIHMIHGAESGNGWMRPDSSQGDALLHLSRRTKLELRVPKERVADTRALSGATLDVGGYPLKVNAAQVRLLSNITILFSRYVVDDARQDEDSFLRASSAQLKAFGVRCGKMLCGRSHEIDLPGERLFTRSLMLAELSVQDSILMQQKGLGRGRTLGCGLFLPHKDIKAVGGGDE
jgi:CRISPR-associated protein Cas6